MLKQPIGTGQQGQGTTLKKKKHGEALGVGTAFAFFHCLFCLSIVCHHRLPIERYQGASRQSQVWYSRGVFSPVAYLDGQRGVARIGFS